MSTRRFLNRLFAHCDGGDVELRALPSTRRAWTALGDWSSLGPFVTAEVNHRENLYVGVATRRDRSSGTTSNLAQLPALFVDWDVPLADVQARLVDFPFPASLLVLSGLGVHGYWLLKEPLDLREAGAVHTAASLLRRLSAHLGGDPGATDPARVLRLPGTFNHKYDAPRAVTLAHDNGSLVNASEFDDLLPAEVVRQNRMVLESTITAGGRNDAIYGLVRSLRLKGLSRPAIEKAIEEVNRTQCDPPLEAGELRKILNHAMRQKDRPDFEPPQPVTIIHDAPAAQPATAPASETAAETAGVWVNLATVEPEAVNWLWPSWLPRKKAVVLAGDPGLGKSMITVDLAARITKGLAWPTGEPTTAGKVLFMCAEDGLADTVRPRLDAAGGDARQVEVLTGVRTDYGDRLVNLALDVAVLEDGVRRYQPALIVIDPITAYLGATDSYKDSEVRRVLAPLLDLVDRYACVLLWVAHLTKASERKALYRPGASIAFVAAARVALIVGEHPEEPQVRVAAQGKNNLAPLQPSVTYSVDSGRVVWGASATYSAEDILQPTTPQTQEMTFTAKGLIATLRQEHPEGVIDVHDAYGRGELADIPERTLRYAARQAGLVGFCKGRGAQRQAFWFDPTKVQTAEAAQAVVARTARPSRKARKDDDETTA